MTTPAPWMMQSGAETGKSANEYKSAWQNLGQLNANLYGNGQYNAAADNQWQKYYSGGQGASPGQSQQGNQGGFAAYGRTQGLMAPNPGESQQQFDGRVNQPLQGLKDRGSNPAWYGFGPQHDTGQPMSGGAYSASSPGQARSKQQPSGTPYNPQQGQNFAGFGSQQGGAFSAWNPNIANNAQAPRPPASQDQAFQFGGVQPQMPNFPQRAGFFNNTNASVAPTPGGWPAHSGDTPRSEAVAPRQRQAPGPQGPARNPPAGGFGPPHPVPQLPGQTPGPSFSHPLAQHLPAFQFRATDFMGNQFNNPGAFTAQQGATAHALNQQRTQQILNMFTNGTPLGGLSPMAAYHQGQQMLQG